MSPAFHSLRALFPPHILEQDVAEAKTTKLGISPWLLCPSPNDNRREVFILAVAFVKDCFF